jgi:hypothetical protein
MTEFNDTESSNLVTENKGENKKAEPLSYIKLSDYLVKHDIKVSDFIKSSKKFKKEFDEEKLTIEFRNLKFDGSEYLDRVFEVASKIVVPSKDRRLAKKIVEVALGRYGIVSDGQHPPSFDKSDTFFSMQRTFVSERIKDFIYGDKQQRIDAIELIDFELKLTRLLFLFLSAETWFTGSYLMKVLIPFEGLNTNKKETSFSNSIKALSQTDKSIKSIISIVSEFSSIIEEARQAVNDARSNADRLHAELSSKERQLSELHDKIKFLENEVATLTANLREEVEERQSDQRISSVGQSELKARVQKSISSLIRDELNLINEMLSDGDEFHSRVLKHVSSLKSKLEELKHWTSSSG